MEFNIHRALSECGDVYVKKKLESVLKILEEIRMKKGSVQFVRRFIGRVGRVYTINLHLPVEIICKILLFLPFSDLLESRACFSMCKQWTNSIYEYKPFWAMLLKSRFDISISNLRRMSVKEMLSYSVMRHTLELRTRKSVSPDFLILNVEQEHSKVEDGIESLIESYDYVLWLSEIDFVQVSFFASSEKFFVQGENRVVITFLMSVLGRSLLHLKITLNYHKIVLYKETFDYLEELGVMSHLLSRGIISSPFLPKKKEGTPCRLKGDLQTFSQLNSPTLTKVMFIFMGLVEVISENYISTSSKNSNWSDEGLRFERWKLRKYILSDVTSWVTRVQFVVKTTGFREIKLEDYLKKSKFFNNTDLVLGK